MCALGSDYKWVKYTIWVIWVIFLMRIIKLIVFSEQRDVDGAAVRRGPAARV